MESAGNCAIYNQDIVHSDGSEYEYRYFVDGDNASVYGFKRMESDSPHAWIMDFYLPGGQLVTESGDQELFPQIISEESWSGSLSILTQPPSEEYSLEHSTSFTTTALKRNGSFKGGFIDNITNLWSCTEASPASISLLGEYSTAETPSLFTVDIRGKTHDGGAFIGSMGGYIDDVNGMIYTIYIDPSNTEAGILQGVFSGQAEPASNTWKASGSIFPKEYTNVLGNVTADTLWSSLANGQLVTEKFTGSFGTSGTPDIKGRAFGRTSSIQGQDWGIFRISHGVDNSYVNQSSGLWSATLEGQGRFGNLQDNHGAWKSDPGLWSMDLSNGIWLNNEISGDLSGKFLTLTKTGTLQGKTIGTYASGSWQGVSMGSWTKTSDLTFSNSFVGDMYFLRSETAGSYHNDDNNTNYFYHYNEITHEGGSQLYNEDTDTDTRKQYHAKDPDGANAEVFYEEWVYDHSTQQLLSFDSDGPIDGFDLSSLANAPALGWDMEYTWTEYNMSHSGHFKGILGGLEDLWSATATDPAAITLLAQYDMPSFIPSGQALLFYDRIESYDPYNDTATASLGGAYSGYLSGILSGTVDGRLYALYRPVPERWYPKGRLRRPSRFELRDMGIERRSISCAG